MGTVMVISRTRLLSERASDELWGEMGMKMADTMVIVITGRL